MRHDETRSITDPCDVIVMRDNRLETIRFDIVFRRHQRLMFLCMINQLIKMVLFSKLIYGYLISSLINK